MPDHHSGVTRDYAARLRHLAEVPQRGWRRLRYGPEPGQFGDLWEPAHTGRVPVAVLIHGGYWRARYRLDVMNALAADLVARGYAVWNLEYRRTGMPGGGWPGTFADVAAGIDLLASAGPQRLDIRRVTVIGHSAGGHLALWSAARHRRPEGQGRPRIIPAHVVSLAGVCDLVAAARLRLSDGAVQELLGGDPGSLPGIYAQACPRLLLPLGTAQTVLHGTADTDVPLELSADYAAAASRAGDDCTFHPLPGADHFDLIDPATPAWASAAGRLA